MNYKEILEEIKKAVRTAAEIIPSKIEDDRITAKDGKANMVTDYDVAVEKKLYELLNKIKPDAGFVGEEDTKGENKNYKSFFVVDPIDGTTNFVQGMRKSAVSVAYAEENEVKAAVVYDPYCDEMFYAYLGGGAYLNGNKISVSERSLDCGVVIFGASPYYEELITPSFKLAEKFLRSCRDIRRFGAASLEMCYVAAGRAEAQFEMVLSPWDYAAAQLIVTEAGGIAGDMKSEKLPLDRKSSVLCGNKKAYNDAKKIVENILDI